MRWFMSMVFCLASCSVQASVVDFEGLQTNASGYYNGNTSAGSPFRDNYTVLGTQDNFGSTEYLQQWTSGGVAFQNEFTPDFGSWSGWSWSNVQDATTPGFLNQYASFAGGGSGGSSTYAVGFGDAYFNLPTGAILQSLDLSNTTYAALSMRDGDAFAKKFGGDTGADPDFFRVTLTGFADVNGQGNSIGATTIALADYTAPNQASDYILAGWLKVDLSALSGARSVKLSFSSSDTGPFGINTPAYVAIDNLTFSLGQTGQVPEPSTALAMGMGSLILWFARRPKDAANRSHGQAKA